MDSIEIDRLIEINRRFYRDFAAAFDSTRARLQPGVEEMLADLLPAARILDLGMGNGNLYQRLAQAGFQGEYTGLDFSPNLVRIAAGASGSSKKARFEVRDLSAQGWDADLDGSFDRILAFAVLHHLPVALARAVLTRCRELLAPGGRMLLSCWQFLRSERWRGRIQDWSQVGLDRRALDPDDYLLDWQNGGQGLRYVHFYDEHSLHRLAGSTGFRVCETFYSDGKEGDLGLYQVWECAGG